MASIYLAHNAIAGALPESWLTGGLPGLTHLELGDNAIDSLPTAGCLGPPLALRSFSLRANRLQGPLPWGARQCGGAGASTLEYLDLSYNALTSSLPPNYPALFPGMGALVLGGNALSGTLPHSWAAGFPALRALLLSGNRLSGTVPPVFLEKPTLTMLGLASNSFSGTLPDLTAAPEGDDTYKPEAIDL